MWELLQIPLVRETIRIATVVLLPMIPAYVLYKALPGKAYVTGPLEGFTIRLTGGFAGYFCLVLLLLIFWRSEPKYELWEVKGQVRCKNCPEFDIQRMSMNLRPPNQSVTDDGLFNIQIARAPGMTGEMKFPTLVIEHPDYATVSIDLNEATPRYGQMFKKLTRDNWSREIIVEGYRDNAIALEKKLPYVPAGTPPQAITTSQVGALMP